MSQNDDMLTNVSFVLGKTYGSIRMILEDEPSNIPCRLLALESQLRQDIERLYYPTRDPSAIE